MCKFFSLRCLKFLPFFLGMTIIIGYFQQRHSLGMYTVEAVRSRKPLCSKYMILIGGLRYATAFLGLYALKYVEVSFTETVKSTAPAFTLLISSLILGTTAPI